MIFILAGLVIGVAIDLAQTPIEDKIIPLVITMASGTMVFNFCKSYLLDYVDLSKI